MKKLLILLLVSCAYMCTDAQTFGEIRGKNNAGTYGPVQRTNDRLKTYDSTVAAILGGNLRIDSSTTRIGIKVLQLPSITLDSSTQRVGVKLIQNPTITNDSSTLSRKYVKVSAVEGTVATTLDSSTQRVGVKILSMPSVTANTSGYATTYGPVYANGTTQNLSLDTLGNLRVYDSASHDPLMNISENSSQIVANTWNLDNTLKDVYGDTTSTYMQNVGGIVSYSIHNHNYDGTFAPLSLDQRRYLRVTQDTAYGAKTSMKISELPVAMNTGAASSTTQRVVLANEQGQDLLVTGQGSQTALNNNIILASAGSSSYDVQGTGVSYRSAVFQIIPTGTISGGVYAFEGSNDNTNWMALYATDITTGQLTQGSSYSPATGTNRLFAMSIQTRYIRVRISTAITGGGSLQCFSYFKLTPYSPTNYSLGQSSHSIGTVTSGGVGSLGDQAQFQQEDAASANAFYALKIITVRNDTLSTPTSSNGDWSQINVDKTGSLIVKDQRQHRRTYNAAFSVVAASSATDIVEIIGSSSKTVLIHKITISGSQTTGGQVPVYIIKRSTAASGGTSTNPTYVPRSTIFAEGTAATAAIKVYTANPTTGTAVGNIWVGAVGIPASTGTDAPIKDIDFNLTGAPVLLSGTSQTLCINLNGATYSGNTFYITVEWSETGE